MNEITVPPGLEPTGDTDAYLITAPVELPSQEQMKVKLVPIHLLSRFEEARSDEKYWGSMFWTLVGAILGAIITWLASDPISVTTPSLIIVVLLVVMSFFTYRAFSRYRNRATNIKKEIEAKGEIISEIE